MGVRSVPQMCILYPGICFTPEENHEKVSQDDRRALGCSAPNAIRLVDLAIGGNGLDGPACSCRPWLSRKATGSTFGQRHYLPSWRTRGFPTSDTFESNFSVRALIWSANSEHPDPRYLPLT